MDLVHYSAIPLKFNRRRKYEASGSYKPNGFWVSVRGDDDWEWWCRSEDFHIDSLQCTHTVVLRPDANILFISTQCGMEDFQHRYAVNIRSLFAIAWEQVRKKYDGLIISPYRWSYRLNPDFMWYYGWDCASGCIWNLDAVESVSLFNTEIPNRKESVCPK